MPAAGNLQTSCPAINGLRVQLGELASFCDSLPPDEKDEQLRDWALYGLEAKLGIPSADSLPPVRYPHLKELAQGEISPGRVRSVSSDDALLVIGADDADNLPLIGTLLDDRLTAGLPLPGAIHIFAYSAGVSSEIVVSYLRTVPGKELFTPEYGYFEKEVRYLDDLREFLERIDDLTLVRWRQSSLVFAGRKRRGDRRAALPLEAIAVLYQAYNDSPDTEAERRKAYNDFINKKYEEAVRNDRQLRKMIREGRVNSTQIFAALKRKMPYRAGDRERRVGFSLDPKRDIERIAGQLEKAARKDPAVVPPSGEFAAFIDSRSAEIAAVAARMRSRNAFEPFLALRRRYANAKDRPARFFDHLLQNIELDASYQAARYDGNLQGTLPGMLLFYTDLTAKLWALDFGGVAPRGRIRGFRAMDEIRVPRLYWNDFVKLSKTRLWFGIRPEGFDIDGNVLRFAPVATRVYAASSSPLSPGKETTPNYQSAEFLGWWDRHYAAVADFEPEYHRLNQIQKWGCVFTALKEQRSHVLDFLFSVPVARDLDFETWYKNTGWLTGKTDLPFLDRAKYGSRTECFQLLHSRDYPLMGQRFFLSGGVSLASRKDILAKLKKGNTAVVSAGRRNRKAAAPLPAASARPSLAAKRAHTGNNAQPANYARSFGGMKAQTDGRDIVLRWNRGAQVVASDIVDELVARQEAQLPGYKDERLFAGLAGVRKAVRIEQGKIYLLQSGQDDGGWILLKINDGAHTKDFPIKRAGASPDADIFYARPVTGRQVETMKEAGAFEEMERPGL